MIHKVILAAILILSANQTFSQDSIKGSLIDYETKQSIFGATIADANNLINGSPSGGGISDRDGNFNIAVKGNKINFEIYFVTYYPIKFFNIPKGDKTIDLKEIKMLRNHLTDHIVTGRPSHPYSEEQWEQDKKLRTDVLKNYRIIIMGKKLKPYFAGPIFEHQYLVFDFVYNGYFGQDSIKGRIISDDKALPGATIFDLRNNRLGAISDRFGNFEFEVKGEKIDLEIQFIGCCRVRIINIPKADIITDLKDIKMISNPGDGDPRYQGVLDNNWRMKVLENYRINILGKNLKPYFNDNLNSTFEYLVFDFDKQEE